MGAAASAASVPPEAVAPADPPAKEEIQPAPAASAPQEAVIQPAAAADAPREAVAPADSPANEEIQSSAAVDAPGGDAEAAGETVVLDAAAAEAGEEEGECGFCLYMKGGGCKEEFIVWEKCVEEAEAEGGGDIVERCAKATTALRKCMDNYAEYYEPILRAERAMSEDLDSAAKAEAEAGQASPASPPAVAAEGEQGDNSKHAEEVEQVDNKKQAEEVVVVKDKEDLAA